MLRFYADRFFSLSSLLQQLASVKPEYVASPLGEHAERIAPLLDQIREDCEVVGLRVSVKQVDRIAQNVSLPQTTIGSIATLISDLQTRIYDEMTDALFFQIPANLASFFDDPSVPDSLGTELADAAFDLDEAGKCMALGRTTAGAFHLMRAFELGLRKFVDLLGITLTGDPSWGPMIKSIDDALKAVSGPKKETYAQILTAVISVKNAFRNPTMHVGRIYDQGQGLVIYMATRLFLDTLRRELEIAAPPAVSPITPP